MIQLYHSILIQSIETRKQIMTLPYVTSHFHYDFDFKRFFKSAKSFYSSSFIETTKFEVWTPFFIFIFKLMLHNLTEIEINKLSCILLMVFQMELQFLFFLLICMCSLANGFSFKKRRLIR